MSTQYKILVGDSGTPQGRVPKTGDQTYLAPVTLSDATGNEVAFDIQGTVNKATSGNDTILRVNQTDTLSPGVSLLADFQAGGVSFVNLGNTGVSKFHSAATDWIGFNSSAGALAAGFLEFAFGGARKSYIRGQSSGELGVFADLSRLTLQGGDINGSAVKVLPKTNTRTSSFTIGLEIVPVYNQTSGTAANTDLLVNRTETAVGSGAQNFFDCQIAGTSKVLIDNTGTYEADKTTADEGFINFKATIDGDATSAISSLTTSGGVTHHIQFEINGTTFWIAGSTTDPS